MFLFDTYLQVHDFKPFNYQFKTIQTLYGINEAKFFATDKTVIFSFKTNLHRLQTNFPLFQIMKNLHCESGISIEKEFNILTLSRSSI